MRHLEKDYLGYPLVHPRSEPQRISNVPIEYYFIRLT